MLEEMLRRYHANAITAAEVVKSMIQIRQEMQSEDKRKAETGLSDEELASYDAIAGLGEVAFHREFLCDLVREVAQAVKRNLKVDWTKPHRENVQVAVLAGVKMVLRHRHIRAEQFQTIHPQQHHEASRSDARRSPDGGVNTTKIELDTFDFRGMLWA